MENPAPEQLANYISRFTDLLRALDSEVDRTVETYRPQIEELCATFGSAIHHLYQWQEQKAALYPKLSSALIPMIQRNWFISGYFGLSEISELSHLCGTLTEDMLDSRIADMYRNSMAEHVTCLVHDYPARAFVIQPATDAHARGEYALSVPIFFVQADGISYDRVKKYIFRKESGQNIQNVARAKLETLAQQIMPYDSFSRFMEMMWRSLTGALPIKSSLNRHTILHGIALEEYATEENSLKAFSLLSHVGALMSSFRP